MAIVIVIKKTTIKEKIETIRTTISLELTIELKN